MPADAGGHLGPAACGQRLALAASQARHELRQQPRGNWRSHVAPLNSSHEWQTARRAVSRSAIVMT
jgi:hypothetical protein